MVTWLCVCVCIYIYIYIYRTWMMMWRAKPQDLRRSKKINITVFNAKERNSSVYIYLCVIFNSIHQFIYMQLLKFRHIRELHQPIKDLRETKVSFGRRWFKYLCNFFFIFWRMAITKFKPRTTLCKLSKISYHTWLRTH